MLRNRMKGPFSPKHHTSDASSDGPQDIRIQVPPLNSADTEENVDTTPIIETKKENLPVTLRIRYAIWLKLQYLSKYEFKFALKMAVAVSVLCVPAFIPSSSDWYYSVRGQWAALTVIAIMNPTRYESLTHIKDNVYELLILLISTVVVHWKPVSGELLVLLLEPLQVGQL
jgi:hypothetical protein